MSDFQVGHGDAVAIGLAADVLYCAKVGLLKKEAAERVLIFYRHWLETYHPLLHAKNDNGAQLYSMVWRNSVNTWGQTNHHIDPGTWPGS